MSVSLNALTAVQMPETRSSAHRGCNMQTRQPVAHHGGYEPLGHGRCSLHSASQHPDPPRGVSNGKRPHNGIACARAFPLSKIGASVASVMY